VARKAAVAVALAFVLAACGGGSAGATYPATAPKSVRIPDFTHVVVVVFENHEATSIAGNPAAPTFNALARRYARLTDYDAVAHPSLPNYLALVSGSTQHITSSCVRCRVDAPSLADTLEAAGRTWKAYLEGLPRRGFLGGFSGRYAKKHDPFAYFVSIAHAPARAQRLVPLGELAADVRAGALPDYSLVVPDMCNSMHDCPVRVGDGWLRRRVGPLLRVPDTVVFVVFDEGTTKTNGGGHVPALALGTAVRPHSRFRGVTNHYGLLRTIEDAWGLPYLGRSATARPITGIWR
jgi:phosphatidylinositol-3-phosphatase